MKIVISPYSAKLRSGNRNPKEFPYWSKLVSLLRKEGYEVLQLGITGETLIEGVDNAIIDWPFTKIKDLINDVALWISCDSWLPHFCHCEKLKPGIVLFGQSDPLVFGYPENTNLLRGGDFLRRFQFQTWEETEYQPAAFVYAEQVLDAVRKLAPLPYIPPPMLLTAGLYQ